ncbi:hypothetical protein [Reichenbachiella ulvae]|uniref:Uncharacterized protein n=1 Tax=Reichenbachiella ulvae TaxID=2980104 RepID=A0ABT3CQW0_9BACT|nr:hypothetical protein [Reichenbachiella ulvae]MCV9386088.1 hypothetical protein [Reichenbachiella ulvae]
MFTEYEIETLLELEDVKKAAFELKKDFIKTEAPYLEISDQDFFSLIMMTPTLGIALADGNVSFFEEMRLNRKARKLSQGGYFMIKDPVVFGMKFLLKKYNDWEDKFLKVIRLTMEESFNISSMEKDYDKTATVTQSEYRKAVLDAPYILIRFLVSFFLEEDDDIFSRSTMTRTDYDRMLSIAEKLGLNKVPLFHFFCANFDVH